MIRPMSPPPAPAANPAQFAPAPATAAASQGAGSPTTEPASAPQAVGSGGGVQPAAGSGGGGSGSGGGGTPTTVSLHQSGDSLGYTDPNGNAFNQIGGLEDIAFGANLVPVTNVNWSVEISAYSGLAPTPPNHSGENAQYLADWSTGNQDTGKFYWPEDPGTYTILAGVTFQGGGTATGSMTITVQAPTLNTFTDTYQGVTKYNVKVAGGGQAANFVNAFDDGTTHKEGNVFNASISTSTLNSNLPASQRLSGKEFVVM